MQIPMILFTIIIEKRTITAEQREALYLQRKAIEQLEKDRSRMIAQFPEYCSRV